MPGERKAGASRVTLTVDILAPVLADLGAGGLDRELRFFDADREEVASAPILDCLSAELVYDGRTYLLADGQFFLVDSSFLSRLNDSLAGVRLSDLELPCYSGGHEADWNRSVSLSMPEDFACVDTALIRLEGEAPFEAADLVHRTGALVHVKRKGRSSALSYLFVQAEQSCRFIGQVPDARAQLRALLAEVGTPPARAALAALEESADGLEICLAILGDWQGRGLVNLPLLAKIELVETIRKLSQWGFRPSLAMVGLCSRPPTATNDSP